MSEVILAYEADIIAEQQKNQEEYDRAVAEYPETVKAAKERYDESLARYDADLAAYNEKSTAKKLVEKTILDENNKPVKPGNFYPPSKPYLREVRHQKVFNKEMLANSYLKLDGFTNSTDNALKITVTLYGFESSDFVLKSSESSYYNSKTKQTSKVMKYWYEISYKNPINLKIETPNGEIIINETFAQFNEFVLNKTPETQGSQPNINRDSYIESLQSKIVESNMKEINDFINNNYGFPKYKREFEIYRVETKKMNYDDYQTAFESAVAGYKMLISDKKGAFEKLNTAIAFWEKAYAESDINDKKARINSDITIITLFNLIEAKIWTDEYAKAEEYLNKIIGLNPSRKENRRISQSFKRAKSKMGSK